MLEPTADLCATLMELPHTAGLMELALIRRELGQVDDESPETYSGPRSSMKLAQARHHHDPWPIIEARRSALSPAASGTCRPPGHPTR